MSDKTDDNTPEENLKSLEQYLQESTMAIRFSIGLTGQAIKTIGDFAHDTGLAWLRLMEDLGGLIEPDDPDRLKRGLPVSDGDGEGCPVRVASICICPARKAGLCICIWGVRHPTRGVWYHG